MSKQLTLSAALSVVLMAGFAVFGSQLHTNQASAAPPQQHSAAVAPQLPVVALNR